MTMPNKGTCLTVYFFHTDYGNQFPALHDIKTLLLKINPLIVYLRYGLRPGVQSVEPPWGGVPWGLPNCHVCISICGGWCHHLSLQQRLGHERAHRTCWLCPACRKSGLCICKHFLSPCVCTIDSFEQLLISAHLSPSSHWLKLWTRSNICLMVESQERWSRETAPSSLDRVGSVEQRNLLMQWITLWLTCCSILPGIVLLFT